MGKRLSNYCTVQKKLAAFMIPYYVWGVVDLIVFLIVSGDLWERKQLIYFLVGMRGAGEFYEFTGALWFLTALLVAELCLAVLIKLTRNNYLFIVSVILFLLYIKPQIPFSSLPLNVDVLPFSLFFVFIGYMVGDLKIYDVLKSTGITYKIVEVILSVCLLLVIVKRDGLIDIFSNEYNSISLLLLGGLLGFILIIDLSCVIDSLLPYTRKAMLFIGYNSLFFMVIHQQIIIHPLNMLGIVLENPVFNFGMRFTLCVVLCSIFCFCRQKIKARHNGVTKVG